MIRISQLKLHTGHNDQDLRQAVVRKLRIKDAELVDFVIRKKSIDARHKDGIRYSYTIDAATVKDEKILKYNKDPRISRPGDESYHFPEPGRETPGTRPLIIGSGPSGLFAGYFLALKGLRPVILERGKDMESRIRDVEAFWETGRLNPDSNIQFGEGGAGTFSDGKLNTGNHDPYGRNRLVLETFVQNGAPKEILFLNKPHLGTDLLISIITGMRKQMQDWGCDFHFQTCFSGFILEGDRVRGVRTSDGKEFYSDDIILAIGHSARDTYDYIIRSTPLHVAAKPFAVGVRVEHRQKDIDRVQYAGAPEGVLPAADYKLTYRASSGRSVYSFCMCPGGYVVNSSSEEGAMCINGMSYSKRDGENANSAIVAAVKPSQDPMENISFVKDLETKAYAQGNGRIVSQLLGDFEKGRISSAFGTIQPAHKGKTVMGDIHRILPDDICSDILEAMHDFGRKIPGFDAPDVILSAVESRTSSPVRILRNEDMESNVKGIYPVGEGAGYAGGIMSAAVDGIKAFEKIYQKYRLQQEDDAQFRNSVTLRDHI